MPSADPAGDFLLALEASGFLSSERVQELQQWTKSTSADTNAIAKELNKRAWLTPFQIREIYRGRVRELTIGAYQLLDLIGEGGMGRVYRAHHPRLQRDVALKVIRKEKLTNPQTVRRFRQEIQAVAQLSHPNVVLAFDADEANGDHFLAMELVDGTDLTKMVQTRGPLPVMEACDYIRQASLGLHHAYERGLVHRDIKPSNMIAAKNGQVKILDLGLALLNETSQQEDAKRVTQEGYVIGTPDFLAPEQARNPLQVDTRADIYALGATLFYLISGKVPYAGDNPTEKLMKHVMAPPPSLREKCPTAPVELDRLIQWLMAKDPTHRPQTPLQVAQLLGNFCPTNAQLSSRDVMPLPTQFSAVDPVGSSQAFRLPASEAPARVRERAQQQKGFTGWIVGLVALVLLGTSGFLLYEFLLRPEPPLEATHTNAIGMKFVLIAPGTFTMGSPMTEPGRGPEEGPTTDVTLTEPYFIGITEVTNQQFTTVMSRTTSWAAGQARDYAQLPVESLTWNEAVEFCEKLNARERTKRRGWAYRLPTEAEWEYACRAGTKTAYSPGDQLRPDFGETLILPTEDEAKVKPPTMPNKVGQSVANPFGLHDCHGNVSEWCQDYFLRGLPGEPKTNPTGPSTGDLRVVRGGAFNFEASQSRSASRRGLAPEVRHVNIGFRVVFAPSPKLP
jgi:eukaryotic-like serine/threonine-protein kinase